MLPRLGLSLVMAGSLAACGGPGSESGFSAGTQSSATVTTADTESSNNSSSSTGTPPDDTTSTSSGSSASMETGATMDIPDFDPPDPLGCEGRIDFLFVISAQSSMQLFQQRLINSFKGFTEAIQAQLPDFDVHILATDGDASWQLTDCSVCTDDCDPQGTPPYCGAALESCDKGKFGAGITFPAGTDASNRRCELDSGRRYITSGQQDMADAFACIAQVGTGGGGAAAQAMVAALQPAINDKDDPAACNSGFLRNDALLVVTIIMDSYDEYSLGTVDEWIEALRVAKKGDDDAFMVLVLTTDVDVGFEQLCIPDQWNQTKNPLRLLGEGVEHGYVGSICLGSYDEWFAEHVGHIVDLCDGFVVPG